MKGKEFSIYLILVPVLICISVISGVILDVDISFIIIMSVIMCLIYLTGIFALRYIYKKIVKVRGYMDSDTVSNDNPTDYIEEKYLEGELGKLAMCAYDLKKRLYPPNNFKIVPNSCKKTKKYHQLK